MKHLLGLLIFFALVVANDIGPLQYGGNDIGPLHYSGGGATPDTLYTQILSRDSAYTSYSTIDTMHSTKGGIMRLQDSSGGTWTQVDSSGWRARGGVKDTLARSGLSEGTIYWFRTVAVDSSGNRDTSTKYSVTTLVTPVVNVDVSNKSNSVSFTSYQIIDSCFSDTAGRVRWYDSSSAASWTIRDSQNISAATPRLDTLTRTGLTKNTTYKIRAVLNFVDTAVVTVTTTNDTIIITQLSKSSTITSYSVICSLYTNCGGRIILEDAITLDWTKRDSSTWRARGGFRDTLTRTGLTASTQYDFHVVGADSLGSYDTTTIDNITTLVAVPVISYTTPVSILKDKPCTLSVSNTGGVFDSLVFDSLPAGLTYSKSTGAVVGSPDSIRNATSYRAIAYNLSGTDTATISIAVRRNPQIWVDYAAMQKYSWIPTKWKDSVKKKLFVEMGESHGRGYLYGLNLLHIADASFPDTLSFVNAPLATTVTGKLRGSRNNRNTAYGWSNAAGEEDFWTHDTSRALMLHNLRYMRDTANNPVNVHIFGWCNDDMSGGAVSGTVDSVWHTRWGGHTVGGRAGSMSWGLNYADSLICLNPVSMDDYLRSVNMYNDSFPGTKTVFTTGPIDNSLETSELGFQRYVKHEYIRDYVRNDTNRVMLDYADITAYDTTGVIYENAGGWTDTWGIKHVFPSRSPDIAGEYDYGGYGSDHLSEAGTLRLGKAVWVLMARVAGWNGIDSGDVLQLPDISYTTPVYDTISKAASHAVSNVGGDVDSFTVSTTLPGGLSLNKTTGLISGTPTTYAAAADYYVTAHNATGKDSVAINISVDYLPAVFCAITVTTTTGGTVNPSGVQNDTCGDSIRIIASKTIGYNFAKWTRSNAHVIISDSLNDTTYVRKDDSTAGIVTANFSRIQYTLTVTDGGHGSTTPAGAVSVDSGTAQAISYTADENYRFTHWSVTAGSVAFNGDSTSVYLNSGNGTVQANFDSIIIASCAITVASAGNGTVIPSGAQTDTCGDALQIIAVPDAGYIFGKWTRSGATVIINDSLNDTTTVYKSDSTDGTVVANFIATFPTIVSITPNGVPGDPISIQGTVFSATPSVTVAGVSVTPISRDSVSFEFLLPAIDTLGPVEVILTNATYGTKDTTSITYDCVIPTITYAPVSITRGAAITPIYPTVAGNLDSIVSIISSLPAGLTVNKSTGAITGTATAPAAGAPYPMAAYGCSDSTATVLSLTVADRIPVITSVTTSYAGFLKPLGGDTVTIRGQWLRYVDTVWFMNEFSFDTLSMTDTLIKVITPGHAVGAVLVAVSNSAGSDTLLDAVVYSGVPNLTISPLSNLDTLGGDTVWFRSLYGMTGAALIVGGAPGVLSPVSDSVAFHITAEHEKGVVAATFIALGLVREFNLIYGNNIIGVRKFLLNDSFQF